MAFLFCLLAPGFNKIHLIGVAFLVVVEKFQTPNLSLVSLINCNYPRCPERGRGSYNTL